MVRWPLTGINALQGRLIDHLRNTQSVGLEDLQALVLDEADRLLEMGFAEEVSTCSLCPCCRELPHELPWNSFSAWAVRVLHIHVPDTG